MNNILNELSDGTNYVDNFAGNNGDLVTFLRPQQILDARLFKFNAQFEF